MCVCLVIHSKDCVRLAIYLVSSRLFYSSSFSSIVASVPFRIFHWYLQYKMHRVKSRAVICESLSFIHHSNPIFVSDIFLLFYVSICSISCVPSCWCRVFLFICCYSTFVWTKRNVGEKGLQYWQGKNVISKWRHIVR